MTLALYGHPFSSYTWKVLVALWENGTDFDYRRLDEPAHYQAWSTATPFKRFPMLLDGDRIVLEASIIIEHLQIHHPGRVRFLPADPAAALDVRMLDRLSDNYLMGALQTLVADGMRPEGERDPQASAQARKMLHSAYEWWNARMENRTWAADQFSLADCAAGPALFYCDWVERIPEGMTALRAYRARLLARESFIRAVNEARPYRHLFPLGAPDRD